MTLVSSERVYSGKVINLDRDTVRFPNNSTGQLEEGEHHRPDDEQQPSLSR